MMSFFSLVCVIKKVYFQKSQTRIKNRRQITGRKKWNKNCEWYQRKEGETEKAKEDEGRVHFLLMMMSSWCQNWDTLRIDALAIVFQLYLLVVRDLQNAQTAMMA